MQETLVCESCNKSWKRQVSRGRKPKLCKQCFKKSINKPSQVSPKPEKIATKIEEVVQVEKKETASITAGDVFRAVFPASTDSKKLIEETKNGSVWSCKKCGATLEVHVPLSDIPTHRCGVSSRSSYYERVLTK